MSHEPILLHLPDIALEKILSFLSYDEIARNRMASLSVDNAQKVMVLGQSKDLGTCRTVKKNGEKCTAFVNIHNCEYCAYHVKQEYQKCSKRTELQSNFGGRGLTALRNKVLGKNEVFYAGKSFTAIPSKHSTKLAAKDEDRLKALNGLTIKNTLPNTNIVKRGYATSIELSFNQKLKDTKLLSKLGGNVPSLESPDCSQKPNLNKNLSAEISLDDSKKMALDVISRLKQKPLPKLPIACKTNADTHQNSNSSNNDNPSIPSLSSVMNQKSIDLSSPISKNLVSRARLNALKYVKKNGPIAKEDPMSVRCKSKKRPLQTQDSANESKKIKVQDTQFTSERFKKIMMLTSKHSDLLEQRDFDEADKYFNKMEKKEQLEEKMVTTYKVNCKAVKCVQCKYISFSASTLCKTEKHQLKVFDAVKRFFKCGDCGFRTAVLEVVPLKACRNCGSGKWEKTGMMKENIVSAAHSLSIRGDEQTFLNSNIPHSSLNLLVPDNAED